MSEQDDIRWELGNMLIGRFARVLITEQRYRAIEQARAVIDAVLDVEELYDAVVKNYRAYELAQAELGIEHLTDTMMSEEAFDESRRKLAVHMNNFLSTARAFLDIAPQRARVVGGNQLMAEFKQFTNEAYDASSSYQFMEALRNYSQHHGVAITGLTLGMTRSDKGNPNSEGEDWKLIHTTEAQVRGSILEDGFPAKRRHLLNDLANKKGMISLTPHTREYMQGLNQVMLRLRGAMKLPEAEAIQLHKAADDELVAAGGAEHAKAAICSDGRGVAVEHVYLSHRGEERIAILRKRNGSIQHLTRSARHS